MSSPCPVPSCAGSQKTGKLMCLSHWRLVSDATQKEVYRTWRAFDRTRRAVGDATWEALRAYRTARDKAIAEAACEQRLHDGNGEG
ncbi:hypothetical protein [Azospirillum agricola]|uniref:hypothetical protein n=1 Tax=Azospirillum agricola TaxID=1720247 RepID=UPI000A0F22C7|nr:hypothetical protein [Azospirillum agricola]SMH62558.1 hypothetical protein SAMN02982994_6361 [Azospirillum lipoferum]